MIALIAFIAGILVGLFLAVFISIRHLGLESAYEAAKKKDEEQ